MSWWERDRGAMSAAMARHDAIVRSAVEGHAGYVFATTGDGLAAAFGRAEDGLQAAVEAQLALGMQRWPEPVALRVRMGLHTGEAVERDGDYFGSAVNRAARLMGAAHGGRWWRRWRRCRCWAASWGGR